ESRFLHETAPPKIERAFAEFYRVRLGITPADEVAALIQKRPRAIQQKLVAALDECLAYEPESQVQARRWFIAVLEMADADPWRKEVRRSRDQLTLEKLAKRVEAERQPVSFLLLLAGQLPEEAGSTRLALLRQVRQAYPGDFWANHALGFA